MLLVSEGGDDLILSAAALYAVRDVVHKMRAPNHRFQHCAETCDSLHFAKEAGSLWAGS